ncbi:hypothetical protein ACVWYH_008272 [Bradyrhizobium sp. GM24.11]
MVVMLVLVFVIAYAAIALEHPLKISKSASALFGAGLLWTIYAFSVGDPDRIGHELDETVTATARIIFFLLGAMTIVEVIDAHDGFAIIASRIRARRLTGLLWLISGGTFFLSAILDNLTTAIVMVSLMRKLLDRRDDRLLFASVIVVAANAGGAWSPMGDVTTTMLWIGGQVTSLGIIKALFLASVVNLLVPLVVLTFGLRGRSFTPSAVAEASAVAPIERNLMLGLGLAVLVLVPAFKQITHLPPFMGILFGLSILWLAGEILHKGKPQEARNKLTLAHALSRIDLSSHSVLCRDSTRRGDARTRQDSRSARRLAGPRDRTPGCHRPAAWTVKRDRGQRTPGGGCDGDVPPFAIPDRQFLVGVHGLLRGNRRVDPDPRIRGGGCRHGHREDPVHVVHAKDRVAGDARLFRGRCGLCRAIQTAALTGPHGVAAPSDFSAPVGDQADVRDAIGIGGEVFLRGREQPLHAIVFAMSRVQVQVSIHDYHIDRASRRDVDGERDERHVRASQKHMVRHHR